MAAFLSGFFKSKEEKEIRRELVAFLSPHVSGALILPEALAFIERKKRELVSDVRSGETSIRDASMLASMSVISALLGSGQHHVYRGTLSNIGQDMLSVFVESVELLVKSEYFSPDDSSRLLEGLKQRISAVG
ncbi:TPA: hypothetical protein UMF74_001671 [Stenotrophomonas maltophilia]|jgi:hypothetical protein|nr:hypothetical protein [Stenotrophomonas maltophilia]